MENREQLRTEGPSLEPSRVLKLADALLDLVGVGSVHALARCVTRAARKLLDASAATFVLSEGDEVYYAEESTDDRLWKGRRFPATACISGWAILNRQVSAVPDVFDDARIPVEAYRPTFVKSLAMAPMLHEGEAVGAVGAYWAERHEATEAEQLVLGVLADAAARALRHAELVEELRRLRPSSQAPARSEGLSFRLLAVVAHDLRTPLSAIATGLQVLGSVELPAAAQRTVARMRRSAERGARLVGQLMDYAEIQGQGALPLRLGRTSLDALCAQAISEQQAATPEARIELDAGPVAGHWDRDRLTEAVGNLLRNAVEHGDRGQPVTVTVRDEDPLARISVHNWGAPIPEAVRPHLFEPFGRAERDSGSIGLGLYIADQIARGHAGHVELESTAERGTTFSLVLPKEPVVVG